jgi:hypothetical protein
LVECSDELVVNHKDVDVELHEKSRSLDNVWIEPILKQPLFDPGQAM